jgi:sulfur carrier protein ThiS
MIKIYSSVLAGGAEESYPIESQQSLLDWLCANGITSTDLSHLESRPLAIFVDGEPVLPRNWANTEIYQFSEVEMLRVPEGTDPFSITFALIFGAQAALKALMPKLPTQKGNNNRQGQGLDEANAKGNKVKLNSIRTQCFGRNPARYPDFATPSRRYFAAYDEQRIEMCMFVGEGYYEIPVSRVKVGETPMNTLGDDARFAIYQPGESLAADPAHLNWYPAPEVGPSSSGSAGLDLTISSDITVYASASAFTFSAKTVAIAVGSGSFPADWTVGLLLVVGAPYPYTVDDGTGTGGRDVINGDIAQLAIPNGAVIEIQGNNAGTYVVFSQTSSTMQLNYLGGTPATGLQIGPVTMVIGYPGQRYRITAIAPQLLTLNRLLENGSIDTTWAGWTARTTNQGQIRIDDSNMTGGYRGAFPACPVGELCTHIEWSVLFSTFLGIGRDGTEYTVTSSHQFEYRDMAVGGAWTVLVKTMSNNTLDSGGYTFREALPYPMRPECRIKRLPKTGGANSNEVKDDSQWYSLFGLLYNRSPVSYEGMTMLTTDIRGGDRLSTSAENLVVLECTRKLPVLRGGAWQPMQATREISATIGHICRDSGYSDTEDLNIAELERLEYTRWTPRGEYYDKIITDQDTVKGYLLEALIPGMAELTIDRGVLTPVRDEARGESFDHIYNPRVMLKPMKRNFTGPGLPDQFNGVDVEYYDHITKQNETVQCRLPGDAGTKVKKEKLEGVGDRTRAWRYGMRVRRAYLYRQGSYEFETELAGLNSAYFSYAGLGDSTPKYGQNAELVSYQPGSPVRLGVSVALDWSKPGTYKVVVRRKDGTAAGPYIATRVDDKTFTIPSLDFVPTFNDDGAMNAIIQFGHSDKWIYPAIITEVVPKGVKTCAMKAVNYDVRMYADDDAFPPA